MDVIVVGAGIIGLSCAWVLSRAGHRVTIFDRSLAAKEASWAGAGMLAPGGEFESDSSLARMAIRSLSEYPGFIRDLQDESGLPIDFRQCGGMEVAFSDAEAELLNEKARRRHALGIVSEAAHYAGRSARFYPDDAAADPRQITRALIASCRARGISLHENEPVIRIAADGLSVETASDTYTDDGVVIAAGAWSSDLYPGVPQTRPVRGHLLAWNLHPGFVGPILRHEHTYILQRSSGLLIAGSSTEEAGFDRSLDEEVIADIQGRAEALIPELRGRIPSDRWNGLRPSIAGNTPAIGRIPGTRVFTAFGHYRNGVLLAPETARLILSLID